MVNINEVAERLVRHREFIVEPISKKIEMYENRLIEHRKHTLKLLEELEQISKDDTLNIPISDCLSGLDARIINALIRGNITNLKDLYITLYIEPDHLLALRNFGEKSLDKLISFMKDKGYAYTFLG